MIKPTHFIILVFCSIIAFLLFKKGYNTSKELHKPRFKLIKEELKATDTTQSMMLHKEDSLNLIKS